MFIIRIVSVIRTTVIKWTKSSVILPLLYVKEYSVIHFKNKEYSNIKMYYSFKLLYERMYVCDHFATI